MEYQCPRCKEWCKTKNSLDWHALQDERCYKGVWDETIADKLQSSILKYEGATEFLLHAYPETRGSYGWLWERYQQIFLKTRVYDSQTQSFHDRKPEGQSAKSIKFNSAFNTLGRCKRHLQRLDKLENHKVNEFGEWISIKPHDCVLASSQTTLKREILDEEHTKHYAPQQFPSIDPLGYLDK